MTPRLRWWLWGVIGMGMVICGVLAALTKGDPFDMESFRLVRDALGQRPLGVYASFAHQGIDRWPYPPGFFAWIYLSGVVASHGGPSFEFMIRFPTILADGAIAWIVQDFLGWAGRGSRTRLAAAGLVSLGPSFVVIAGYHGQIDALAILPGVLAVSLWTRSEEPSRALFAGLLLGLGGALKTVPLLLVLALLPSARSRREAVILLMAAAGPVLVAFLPFAVAGLLPAPHVLLYRGLPGVGDLSLVAQPDLAGDVIGTARHGFSPLTRALIDHGSLIVVAGLLAVAGIGARTRGSAPQMACILWLAVYAFGVNFFFQYLVWGLPFFLLAGYVRATFLAQIALLLPTLGFYLRPWHQAAVAAAYAVAMISVWAISVGGFVVLTRKLVTGRPTESIARWGARRF